MKVISVYRLDYPLYAPDAAVNARPISHDPDYWVEEQPLGLFFKFASLPNGLLVYISNDAEQVCFEVRRAASLAEQTDYFGFLSLVGNSSRLSGITNSNLGEIEFGYASGQSPTAPLLIIVKLLFSSETLFFVNNADEGYYFFDDSRKCADFFSECIELFGMIIWVEQPQLLAQLAAL